MLNTRSKVRVLPSQQKKEGEMIKLEYKTEDIYWHRLKAISVCLRDNNGEIIYRDGVVVSNKASSDFINNLKKRLYEHSIKYINKKKERLNLRYWIRYYYLKLTGGMK